MKPDPGPGSTLIPGSGEKVPERRASHSEKELGLKTNENCSCFLTVYFNVWPSVFGVYYKLDVCHAAKEVVLFVCGQRPTDLVIT